MDIKKIIIGAASGLVSAILVDINAFQKSEGSFNWSLAVKRWISGLVSGALTGLGLGSVN